MDYREGGGNGTEFFDIFEAGEIFFRIGGIFFEVAGFFEDRVKEVEGG